MNLSERSHPIIGIPPQAMAGAIAGDYISMKKTEHVTIAVTLSQKHATPPVLSIFQAKDVSGTDAKALAKAVTIFLVADAAASDLMVKQTDDVDFTPDAALKDKLVLFEVPVENLDVNDGFDCIQVRAGASNALNIITAKYWCTGERYHNTTKIAD